ncbi:DUF1631 family protein [Marinobacter sp. V034]|uniref:DUF1631 family protein n=1 Tax=Marinobacter sp. V034 TaxID=3459610 RepID=UPI004043B3F2
MAMKQEASSRNDSNDVIRAILINIRVPELPYPAGKPADADIPDWLPLLHSCWTEQRNERVINVLNAVKMTWSVRQVNAAYLADRVMDVFLKTSGLHVSLVQRIARLRFLLAWQIEVHGEQSLNDESVLRPWLDGLQSLRGWSDSGGRAARQLLAQLDELVVVADQCFGERSMEAFERFATQWRQDQLQKEGRIGKLRTRLLETEQGASRQRAADQMSRALVARALGNRKLPADVIDFISTIWTPLLRQAAWKDGLTSDNVRHANKLLEWIVWIADPALSDNERDKLYQVGEHLSDKVREVWSRIQSDPLPESSLSGLEAVMVARLRGQSLDLVPVEQRHVDERWLNLSATDTSAASGYTGQWFVKGSDEDEQRLYFLTLLEDSQDVLMTNGEGVKLGLMDWPEFEAGLKKGDIRRLPDLNPFGAVVDQTIAALVQVLRSQVEKRREAKAKAEAQAEALRVARAKAEQARLEAEALRAAEAEKALQLQAEEQQAVEAAEAERLSRELYEAARAKVDALKLGSWIALEPTAASAKPSDGLPIEALKLKLAVRLNATDKLVFVDRLGLNRTEYTSAALIELIVSGAAKTLSSEAEFEDTLSRVVGRIRVGRT